MRQSGVANRAPGWARNAEISGTGDALAVAAGKRQAAHPQPLDAARVGVEHLEFEPPGVQDHLAAPRDPSSKREDQPAQRIDVLVVAVMAQRGAVVLLEGLDR